MKTTLAKITGIILLCLNTFISFAQFNSGLITGTVKDSLNHQVIPYATIILKKYTNASFLKAAVTDEKGSFRFEDLEKDVYFLKADFIGYKTVTVDSLQIKATGATTMQLWLATDVKLLNSVTVVGYRPFIEHQADKLVLNVTESPIAAGGTMGEVLSRTPGVIEQNGTYQVRGKNVMVLLDGKNTNLSGSDLQDLLGGLPSSNVAKVEVIANPSAKYDAAGGAVINIITNQSRSYGTNGVFTLGAGMGMQARYNGSISLNHRTRKMNIYGSYDYQYSQPFTIIKSFRMLSREEQVREYSKELRILNNNSLKVGMDYNLNATSSIGILIKNIVNHRNRESDNTSIIYEEKNAPLSSSAVTTVGNSLIVSPSVSIFYKAKLDTAGMELRIGADYFSYNKEWHNLLTTRYFNIEGQEHLPASMLRDNSPADNTIKTFTIDLVRPMKNSLLEAGLKTTFTKTDNDILWEGRTAETDWNVDSGKTNHFIYRENIIASFVSYSTSWQKLAVQVGLRAEQTFATGTSIMLEQKHSKSYLHLFPNLSAQYYLSDKQLYGLSYSKKIDRFKFDIVNPFVTYISQYAYAQGNPNVKPSISHNFEASHTFNNELFTALSYAYHQDVLTEVVLPKEESNAVFYSFKNFHSADEWSGTTTYAKAFFSGKWNTTNTVGFMYAVVHANAEAQLTDPGAAVFFSSNNTLQLGHGLKGELSGSYMSPMSFGAFRFKAQYGGSFGLSKSILKSAGTLTLNVTDVFNTCTNSYKVESFGVNSNTENKAESRFVRLNFSYKFGNKNVKSSKSHKIGNEEEKFRMESN
ncbi:TonB-dependent receptor domain-containing protein [Pontibacter silvestris]|uniref:TonB-dependent receptor domain-containing protein n=1 Tax=Pontibacter silvestris TaxID=2305183 RepID=A0ABW4X0I8_9BACT|nr:outer membrane beta-barrel family protein [Pontibacter silvestris]MCC9135178.1 TonB-dependent receptor [Pontibacter silvestris]